MYKIVWGHTAEQDYLSTLKYWISNNQSNHFSLKLMKAVEKIEDLIIQNPSIGVVIDSHKEVRKLQIMRYYALLYKIDENIIHIIAFWDNRRNPDDFLI